MGKIENSQAARVLRDHELSDKELNAVTGGVIAIITPAARGLVTSSAASCTNNLRETALPMEQV
jgi:bacteriocin-like protein